MVTLIQPGPRHLFWTTGVYYFWSLKEVSKFVFVVPTSYKEDVNFMQKISKHKAIVHIEYIDLNYLSLTSHLKFLGKIRKIFSKYSVDFFLMHNQIYPENQYILNCIQSNDIPRKVNFYQNGRMNLNWLLDFEIRNSVRTEKVVKKIPILEFNSVFNLIKLYLKVKYFVINTMLPFIISFKTFSPGINFYTGSSVRENFVNAKMLVYLDNEANQYKKIGYPKVVKIFHPLSITYKGVFSFVYGEFRIEDSILILPSHGFASIMLKDNWNQIQLVSHISNAWIGAIQLLKLKFPDYPVKMKLHPASKNDPVWGLVQDRISRQTGVNFLHPEVNAEYEMARTRVVVGDVGSCLWWASMIKDKTVISLDIFDYPCGDEMKSYENIYYINNKKLILDTDFCIR